MAPSIKKIEIVFLFFVLIIFSIVIDKYVISLERTDAGIMVEGKIIDVEQQVKYYYYNYEFHTFITLYPATQVAADDFAQDVPVLVYHGSTGDSSEGENVPTSVIKDQLFSLKQAGWNTISIEDFQAFMQDKKQLPAKSFLLTFDDGKKSTYYPIDPILKVLNYKAVMYVITSHSILGKPSKYYLGVSELQEMVDSGRWELQSHAEYGHNYFPASPDGSLVRFIPTRFWLPAENRYETDSEYSARISNDMLAAKNDLESTFHNNVFSFAFPFGDYGQAASTSQIVIPAVKKIYPIGFIQFRADEAQGFYRSNFPALDSFLLRRLKVPASFSGTDVINMLHAATSVPLPYTEDFTNDHRWIFNDTVGTVDISDNALHITTATSTNTMSMYLDGSELWKNYIVQADIHLKAGNTVSVVARYTDGYNNVSCSFMWNRVVLQEMINHQITKLSESPDGYILDENKENTFGTLVDGNTTACLVNGTIVTASNTLDSKLAFGGAGIKIADKVPGSTAVIKSFTATSENQSIENQVVEYIDNVKKLAGIQSQIAYLQKHPPKKPSTSGSGSTAPVVQRAPISALLLFDASGSLNPLNITDFSQIFNNIEKLYGTYGITDEGLTLTTPASSTSSMILINGTNSWNNYKYSVDIDWHSGSSLTLVSDAQDSKNYIGCNYSYEASYTSLFQEMNGVETKLANSPHLYVPPFDSWKDISVGMSVVGNKVSCLVNDQQVVSGEIMSVPTGSIGFEVWDKTAGNVNMVIHKLDANAIEQ